MARRNGARAGFGWMGLGLLVVVAICADVWSDAGSGSSYSPPAYTPPAAAPAPAANDESGEWLYIHGRLNVRSEPDKDAPVVRTLSRGDLVRLGPKDANGWAPFYSGGSPEGYVYRASDRVRAGAPAAPEPPARSSGGGSRRRSGGSRTYHTGPRGGCYYYSASGRKQYVDRSYCR